MNVRQAPKPQPRTVASYNSRWNIIAYDADNLYPQNIMSLVASSLTASECFDRFQEFIEGAGLMSQFIGSYVVNRKGETMNDIHHLCSVDEAMFNGFALHVNYDLSLRPCEIQHVPFENCRLEECDDNDVIAHICVHPDWRGGKTRNGRKIAVDNETIERINVFNPDPQVVSRQIMSAGGIDNYKGQILYSSGTGHLAYPKPRFDSALTDISTDEGCSNVLNRNVRNNFFPAGMLTIFNDKNKIKQTDENGNDVEEDNGGDEFAGELSKLQGDTNACKLLVVTIDYPEEKPEFTKLEMANFDKSFNITIDTTENRIYSSFGQEGWLCLKRGKVGFGGQVIRDIEADYCRRVIKYQMALSSAYMKIMKCFNADSLPDAVNEANLRIKPISTLIQDANN